MSWMITLALDSAGGLSLSGFRDETALVEGYEGSKSGWGQSLCTETDYRLQKRGPQHVN